MVFKDLIQSYIELRNDSIKRSKVNISSICTRFTSDYSNFTHGLFNSVEHLQKDFLSTTSAMKEYNQLTSCNFNLLKKLNIGETTHSSLISDLLNPYSDHGQKHLFINSFLDKLLIKRYGDSEQWVVTAEKGRIDILLVRPAPHHAVVIIENKSNNAVDQENQLYRYWYSAIYRQLQKRYVDEKYLLNPPEDSYQLIYLSPEFWKKPNINSITKPAEWNHELPHLPDVIPIKVKHLHFRDTIVEWLEECLENLPSTNYRFKAHIEQYIEIWK